MSGIIFQGLNTNDSTCTELTNNVKGLNCTGFYFLHVKLKQVHGGHYITVYCGQSLNTIKSRLDDHYNKFYLQNYNNNNQIHKWKKWYDKYKENNILEDKIYYTAFDSNYGAAYENFMIYFNASGIRFHLNTVLNGHSEILELSEVNYERQPFISAVLNILTGEINDSINNIASQIGEILK